MSAAALLAALRARGVQLAADGDRLRWRPREAVTAEERAALAQHKAELLLMLAGYASELAELAVWFLQARAAGRLPCGPFDLARWAHVADPTRFYTSLEADLVDGPRAARARLGGLADDLGRLRELTEQGADP
jgi:hypothetical protein